MFRQYNLSSTFSNMKPPWHPFMVFLALDRFLYVRIFESGCLDDRRDRGSTSESESKSESSSGCEMDGEWDGKGKTQVLQGLILTFSCI